LSFLTRTFLLSQYHFPLFIHKIANFHSWIPTFSSQPLRVKPLFIHPLFHFIPHQSKSQLSHTHFIFSQIFLQKTHQTQTLYLCQNEFHITITFRYFTFYLFYLLFFSHRNFPFENWSCILKTVWNQSLQINEQYIIGSIFFCIQFNIFILRCLSLFTGKLW
jgi:hypothetical protein